MNTKNKFRTYGTGGEHTFPLLPTCRPYGTKYNSTFFSPTVHPRSLFFLGTRSGPRQRGTKTFLYSIGVERLDCLRQCHETFKRTLLHYSYFFAFYCKLYI